MDVMRDITRSLPTQPYHPPIRKNIPLEEKKSVRYSQTSNIKPPNLYFAAPKMLFDIDSTIRFWKA